MKRCLLLGRKAMTNLDRILKSRDITLPIKFCMVKAKVFPVVICGMWELGHKESWALKNWCFWTVVLKKLFRVPWTARRCNQSILKEISPEYSLEGRMLKLKLRYFDHLMRKSWLIGKDTDTGKDWRQEEKGMTEDEMVGWHHWLDGHEFEQALGVGDGQGSLWCYRPWGCKESDTTARLNWTVLEGHEVGQVNENPPPSSKMEGITPLY